MPKTIFVIEDDRDLSTLLDYNLSRAGYSVKAAERLDGTLDQIREAGPDLIILDVMLPDGDGFDFCREIRSDPVTQRIPVLFLTARSDELDRVLGLEIGGDDYVTKPFSPRELLARVKANLRRIDDWKEPPVKQASTRTGPLTLDLDSRRVSLRGEAVDLTATEFKLLELFFSNPGRAYSREQLLRSIWGEDCHVTPRNVDVHIRRLRERIEDEPEKPKWIQTVRGFGYRFESPA